MLLLADGVGYLAMPAIAAIGKTTTGRERVTASLLATFVPCSARSAIILAIVVLGGLGSQIGVVFASIAIIGASMAGIPVSTTHTITGSVVGVGAVKRVSAVRWGVTRRLLLAWILTIPASAAASMLTANPSGPCHHSIGGCTQALHPV